MARRLDPLTRDQILAGQAAGTPIPDGSGRIVRGGVIVSAADAMRAQADRVRNQALEMQTAAYRAPLEAAQRELDRARASGALPAAPTGLPASPAAAPAAPELDAETAAAAQQLLARRAERPDRVYTPETIARATPGQIRGEAAALNAGAPARAAAAQSAAVNATLTGILGNSAINPPPAPSSPRVAGIINALPPVIGPGSIPLGIAAAAGPNITTDTGLPAGSIGRQTGGRFVVDVPGADGPQSFPNEAAARATFAGLTSPISPEANRPAALPMPAAQAMPTASPAEQGIDTTPLTRALAAYRESGAPLSFDALDTIGRLVERATPEPARAPAPGSITLPSGRVIEGITDPTGNFRVIEPERPPRENLSDLGRLFAERDAAIAADRFDVAQAYDERIRRMTSAEGAGQQPMTLNIGGVPITIGGSATPAPATAAPAPSATPAAPAVAPRQFTAGQRVRQNGITYQYDGQNWTPVAQ